MSKKLTDDFELDDIINHIKKSVEKNKEKKKKQDCKEIPHEPINEKINEKKIKNEIFGDSMIDYYSIIGALKEDTQETIIKKCNQKMADYHQDKIKTKLLKYPQEERKKQQARYQMQYELVREAREYLCNPEKRKYYDMQKKSTENNNFSHKKQSFEEFIKLQESEITEENKIAAISNYKSKSAEMDKKHGFDSSQKYNNSEYKFSTDDFKRRYEDIETERTQQDADCLPKNIFERGGFNGNEFNRQWEIMQKKKELKKGKKQDDKSIIKWEGVAAFNDHGECGNNYVSITDDNDDFGGLYNTSKNEDYIFSKKIDSDDEKSLSSIDSDIEKEIEKKYNNNYDNHNKNKNEINKRYEELLKDRGALDNKPTFHSKDWKDVQQNPFNISSQMGEIIGENVGDCAEKKTSKNKKDLFDAYKALLYDNK